MRREVVSARRVLTELGVLLLGYEGRFGMFAKVVVGSVPEQVRRVLVFKCILTKQGM